MKKLTLKLASVVLCLVFLCSCGKTYTFTVLDGDKTQEVTMKSSEVITGPCAVYTAQGEVTYEQDYKPKQELYGVVKDPPEHLITYTYDLAAESLKSGERVMIIYLDGFGYWSYEYALENGLIPSMAGYNAQEVLSVFPTITPVNYAAMVTGRTPANNGVTARGIHSLTCGTIFDDVLEMDKKAYIAEGDTQILSFSVPQDLNPDLDGNGSTDDEVLQSALTACGEDEYALVFVHFHGIDDVSHANGPMAQETLDEIEKIDGYIARLQSNWDGRIIITADHGQHVNDGNADSAYDDYTGVHGGFVQSDIIVPMLTNWECEG